MTAPPGFQGETRTDTIDLTIANPDGTDTVAFVNQRPIVKLTSFGYTNVPNGQPTDGVVTGHTVYTFSVKNFGGAAATLSGSLAVTFSDSPSSFVCSGADVSGCAIVLTGTIGVGQELTFTLVLDYTNAPSGTQVFANLVVNYTLNGLTRQASGSPALIMFTIQGA